jgi:putative ABC transport system permease protein
MKWPWEARREAADRELDEEIRAHFAMAVADRMARGESRADAVAAVRREFGNVAHVKEVTRETWGGLWLERLTQDVRYAVRSLRRAPVFSAVAILTLALGIGANTAMFTVVRGIVLRPLPFRDPGALFVISHAPDRLRQLVGLSMVDREYMTYRSLTRAFAATTSYNTYPATLLGAGEPVRLRTASVTPTFFTTLGVEPRLGRAFRAGDDAPGANNIAIIGYKLWRDRFGGDTAAIGRSVSIEGYRKTIVGVMADGFEFPEHTVIWAPTVIAPEGGNFRFRPVIGRLATTATFAAATAELRTFADNEDRAKGDRSSDRSSTAIVPLHDVVVGNVRTSLFIFTGAVGLVLLIACANVSNLMLMRAVTRTHELGIRAALGASRSRLVRQLLTESLIVAWAGGVIGLGVAYAGVALLLAAAPTDLLPRTSEVHVDLLVLAVTLLTCIVAGTISGTAPAIGASRRDVRDALSEAGRTTARSRLRSVFVTAEAALALLLLIGAGLLLRSFERLRSVDLGFAPGHLVTATLDFPHTRYQTAELLHDVERRVSARIAAIPGVRAAAAVNWLPLTANTITGDFSLEDGRPLPPGYIVLKPCITPDYFAVMGIRIRQGRGFLPSDNASSGRVVIVSRTVAERLWPGESPLGKRLTMADKPKPSDWMTIVGVVDDVVQEGVAGARAQAIYQSLAQVDHPFFIDHINFIARTDGSADARVARAMRSAIRAVDPDQPIESIMTMESRLSAVVAEPRFRSLLLSVFSLLALSLAAIGIYGVLAYSVTERTRELGIRIALGATPIDVVRMVLAGSALLTIPGLILGLAASAAATRVLSGFLFQVRVLDPLTFIGATVLLLVVALCAAYVPARRAGRIDPLIAIK